MKNTWPGGYRHAMHQDEHERWNASNYPGTRQICASCGEPTGRCEEDGHFNADGEALCEECFATEGTQLFDETNSETFDVRRVTYNRGGLITVAVNKTGGGLITVAVNKTGGGLITVAVNKTV